MSGTAGLDLQPDGDDFILIVTNPAGEITRTKLTSDQGSYFPNQLLVFGNKFFPDTIHQQGRLTRYWRPRLLR